MDKVSKREVILEESEKEGMSGVYTLSASRIGNAGERRHPTDSKDLFFNSYPVESMTPEQRKHFRKIMRKEVRE